MKRLLFLTGALALFAAGCLAWGFGVEPGRLVLREVAVESPGWEREPLRIGILSDIHAGGRGMSAARVRRAVEALNGMAPDIVLLPGDFTVGSAPMEARSPEAVADIRAGHAELRRLSASLGVFAVLGNHDHQFGEVQTRANLARDGGIRFLDDKVKLVTEGLCVFGLGDAYFGSPDLSTPERCEIGTARIGLSHNPDTLLALPGRHAFLTAGHTHGGQVNIWGVGRRVTSTRAGKSYAWGRVNFNGTPGFVTAGVGMSILSARFRVPPEVVVVTLR